MRGRTEQASQPNRRYSFDAYLRTGRLVDVPSEQLEIKFNPWHDPSDGRFTFVGTGRFFGRRNGHEAPDSGKSLRGSGASGSWGQSAPSPNARSLPIKIATRPGPGARVEIVRPGTSARQVEIVRPAKQAPRRRVPARVQSRPPWGRIVRNGYEYRLDENSG